MLSDKLLQELAAFCENSGYLELGGSLICHEACPDGYDIHVELDMVVKPSGRYLVWLNHPLNKSLHGVLEDGSGRQRFLMSGNVPDEEKMAVLQGMMSRLG